MTSIGLFAFLPQVGFAVLGIPILIWLLRVIRSLDDVSGPGKKWLRLAAWLLLGGALGVVLGIVISLLFVIGFQSALSSGFFLLMQGLSLIAQFLPLAGFACLALGLTHLRDHVRFELMPARTDAAVAEEA